MKNYLLIFSFLLISGYSNSQNVYVSPNPGSYLTLKEAFDSVNSGYHFGTVIIELTGNTVETLTAILNPSGYGNASYDSVIIYPKDSARSVSGDIMNGAVIKIAGADNVKIDGRINRAGEGRHLTIEHTRTAASSFQEAAIWISDRTTDIFPHTISGAKNNTIRNCEISCNRDQGISSYVNYGIIMNGEVLIWLDRYGKDNNNNKFINNRITKSYFGIFIQGDFTDLNDSNLISQNEIGSNAFDSDRIRYFGLYSQFQSHCTIEKNEIKNIGVLSSDISTSALLPVMGMYIGGTTFQKDEYYKINANHVFRIADEKGGSVNAIYMNTNNGLLSTSGLISNNVIYSIKGTSVSSESHGILHEGGYGDKIVFNSIFIKNVFTSTVDGMHGIRIGEVEDSLLTIKNNSIYMDITGGAGFIENFCITLPASGYIWGTGGCNYNAYYFPPSNLKTLIGGTGMSPPFTEYSTMPSWRFVFTPMQDLLSFFADPQYTSADYLFPKSISPLLGGGTPVSEVTTDILGEVRSSFSPSIGAYEFDSTTLPVELISFYSEVSGRNVNLKWSTSSEFNNAGFYIERAEVIENSELNWMNINFIEGSGNSNQINEYQYTDKNLSTGKYKYRIRQTDFNGVFEYYNLSAEVNIGMPVKFSLSQNYPNPFNPATKFNFDLPENGKVLFNIFNSAGKLIKTIIDREKNAGYHTVLFNAEGLPSGVYFYVIHYNTRNRNFSESGKMMLIR